MSKKNTVKIGKQKVELSNQEKILFPTEKITKGDLIHYYETVSKRMVPKISNRPIMMDRYPNGLKGQHWLQKNISDYFPKWIQRKSVGKKTGANINMVVCNDAASLVYLANQACITPHMWLSKSDKLHYPDRMIFDIDPPKGQFKKAVKAAKELKRVLEKQLNLPTYVLVTGSKGIHVIVPLQRKHTFTQVRAFAKKVGHYLAQNNPKEYTINPRKNMRKGKVFIDYLRNGYGQTVVAPYAIRAMKGAPIAMPVSWQQLSKQTSAAGFNIHNMRRKASQDPWSSMNKKAVTLKTAEKKIDGLLEKHR